MRQVNALIPSLSSTNRMFIHLNKPQLNPHKIHIFPAISLSSKFPTFSNYYNYFPPKNISGFHLFCNLSNSDSISQLKISKQYGRSKPEKKGSAIFGIIFLNLAIYVADIFLDEKIKALYLFHGRPAWYQFVTAAFYHPNWNHLSSNLFFLYYFGKLVEEEEGSFALWLSYILTGAGTNLVSWLYHPKNAISVGASGAVFGLFAISVLVKMSWRKFFEVLIGGPFVIAKVIEAAKASTVLSNGFIGSFLVQNFNRTTHLSGALVGVLVLGLLRIIPSDLLQKQGSSEKTDK